MKFCVRLNVKGKNADASFPPRILRWSLRFFPGHFGFSMHVLRAAPRKVSLFSCPGLPHASGTGLSPPSNPNEAMVSLRAEPFRRRAAAHWPPGAARPAASGSSTAVGAAKLSAKRPTNAGLAPSPLSPRHPHVAHTLSSTGRCSDVVTDPAASLCCRPTPCLLPVAPSPGCTESHC